MSRVPPEVAQAVKERAAGHCEACSLPLAPGGGVFHHRKLRSRGGMDTTENLMEVHMICHNGHRNAIHSRPARSARLGHMVSTYENPADVPVIAEPGLLKMAT